MADAPLADCVAVITGAGGLIGAGIVRQFAGAGAAVVLACHRDPSSAEALAKEIEAAGGRAVVKQADLTDDAQCHGLIEASVAWGGRLDVLVNNAGSYPVQALPDMTTAEWRRILDVNLTSAFTCTQAATAVMAGQGRGNVIHIASIEASQPTVGHAHYNAAKAALVMHARSAALEYGRFGIRVNAVSPGLIDRPGLETEWPQGIERWMRAVPLGRTGRPEDIGNACVFLASDAAAFITGHDLVVDGGISACPTW